MPARQAMLRRPPHILVTTPESLYILLTAEKSRAILETVRTVIVDEIHAVADDKRGAHLALSLERLDALVAGPVTRIGLSATQKPIELVAQFLAGAGRPRPGRRAGRAAAHARPGDRGAAERARPGRDARALGRGLRSHRGARPAASIDARLRQHAAAGRAARASSRRAAGRGRGCRAPRQPLAQDRGSRPSATQGRRASRARGDGVARARHRHRHDRSRLPDRIAAIDRGRGPAHRPRRPLAGRRPEGPVLRDHARRAGRMRGARARDAARRARRARDSRCSRSTSWRSRSSRCAPPTTGSKTTSSRVVRRAYPYRDLSRAEFDEILEMLAEGIAARRGRYGAYLHRDRVNGRVRGRRGARLVAITSGGAIPDTGLYTVVAEPEGTTVGTVDEDFAVESLAGDVMLLGNTSWRIRRVSIAGRVLVEDAHGAAPTIPFWRGEAPARTAELSQHVAEVRDTVSALARDVAPGRAGANAPAAAAAIDWLVAECGVDRAGAEQIIDYVVTGRAVLGAVPTGTTIIAERFFDEGGGMQLVIHAPFGARINKAWGLALRKRFCRSFNFELQAAATDNGINIALAEQHSFPLADVFQFLRPATAREVLEQAALASPIFGTRWRWDASRALALLRFRNGKKVPIHLQRMQSDDLLASVFPDVAACQENIEGDIQIPNHPLIREVMKDVLTEAMDVDGFIDVLERIDRRRDPLRRRGHARAVRLLARDPERQSVRVSRRCAARRATGACRRDAADAAGDRALRSRQARSGGHRRGLRGRLAGRARRRRPARRAADARRVPGVFLGAARRDMAAVASGAGERSPRGPASKRAAERTGSSPSGRRPRRCSSHRRECSMRLPDVDSAAAGVAHRRARRARARLARAHRTDDRRRNWPDGWRSTRVTSTKRCCGSRRRAPSCAGRSRAPRPPSQGQRAEEWCERRLLARIHRLTLGALRREIAPVTAAEFMRWLLAWQHVAPGTQLPGERGTLEVLEPAAGLRGAGQRVGAPAAGAPHRRLQPGGSRSPVPDGAGRLGPPVAASRDPRARATRGPPRRPDERGAGDLLRSRRRGLDGAAAPHGRRSQRRGVEPRRPRDAEPAPSIGRVVLRRHRPRHRTAEGRGGNGAVGAGGRRTGHRRRIRQPAGAHRPASGAPATARPKAHGRVTAPAAGRCCTRRRRATMARPSKRRAGCCCAATASSSGMCSLARACSRPGASS